MDPTDLLLGVAVATLVAWLAWRVDRTLFPLVTVYEHEHALRYRDGRLSGPLDVGRHRLRGGRERVVRVSRRPQLLTLPGQEVLTADGVPVKVSLLATVRVTDPVVALHETEDWHGQVYAALQVALRLHLAAREVDDVLTAREDVASEVAASAADPCAAVGVAVEAVAVKDLMLPGPVRDLFARVVVARKEGQAALERARGETAALRALSNAARLVREQPEIVALRALGVAEGAASTSLVIDTTGRVTLRDTEGG